MDGCLFGRQLALMSLPVGVDGDSLKVLRSQGCDVVTAVTASGRRWI
jgi:hypothetical protein